MSKPRIVKDYDKLDEQVKEQIKLVYPAGFEQHLISYTNKDGERKLALPFETNDVYYLVRMSIQKAQDIITFDDDYDEDGLLKAEIKESYQDKYDDLDYLELNSNDDNDFDQEEEDDDHDADDDDDDKDD
ncbi:MAG: hypothetical protein JXR34_11200 [Bacteroidales bacterium]|nr:hypothetical protein [Bacteroidales bacterium]